MATGTNRASSVNASHGIVSIGLNDEEAPQVETGMHMGPRDIIPLSSYEGPRKFQMLWGLSGSTSLLIVLYCGLLLGLCNYTETTSDPTQQVTQYYQYLIHVNIMVWVGFGFLMTFLRRYSYSAVALNMLASAIAFVEAILVVGAMQQVAFKGYSGTSGRIVVDMPLLINASFAAASGMIAFGAVIGKTTGAQIIWLMVCQVPLYAINQHLVNITFKALDPGGTIQIHLFGCYYGLAASYMISRKQPKHGVDHPKNVSGYLNDIFSMVGTLFLWLYWPSFNGALTSVPIGTASADVTDAMAMSQYLCITNTLLSLLGCTISTFACSALCGKGRLNMLHVQNSTLAGGVAMGAACSLKMTPGGAIVVGTFAGILSVCGYTYTTPFLDRLIGLGDTCGINNLHGMPAVLGGLVAGFAALGQDSSYLFYATGRLQLGWQVVAMLVTFAIAITGGLFVGWILSIPFPAPELITSELFDDGLWWQGISVEDLGEEDFRLGSSKWARDAPEMVNSVFNVGKASVAYNANVYGGSKAGPVNTEYEAVQFLKMQSLRFVRHSKDPSVRSAISRQGTVGDLAKDMSESKMRI